MEEKNTTPFSSIYESFLSKITDDMYMELTKEDTYRMLEDLLISAIPKFEFPRKDLFDYVLGKDAKELILNDSGYIDPADHYEVGYFNTELTIEEINILATYMIVEWIGQQLASIENIRMKFSGTDFKFTSQANHMQKLLVIKKDYEREGFHLQRLYKRRRYGSNGLQESTFDVIMSPKKKEGSN